MKLQSILILVSAATGFSLGVTEIPPEAFGGAGVGLATIALWKFVRLADKADKALDSMPKAVEYLQSIERHMSRIGGSE